MSYEISKELLSDVLDENCIRVGTISKNELSYTAIGFLNSEAYRNINIYELAHKCKERAWQNGHIISSFPTKAYWRALVDSTEMFIMESEPEAVFKAYQWTIDNKDKL